MIPVEIKADLTLSSNNDERLTIKNIDGSLIIHYLGKSVPYLPLNWIKAGYSISPSKIPIAHPIKFLINKKEVYKISSEKKTISNYVIAAKLLFKSIFKIS